MMLSMLLQRNALAQFNDRWCNVTLCLGKQFVFYKYSTHWYYEKVCAEQYYKAFSFKRICFCQSNKPSCKVDDVGPIYRGSRINLSFILNYEEYPSLRNLHTVIVERLESGLNFVCNATGSVIQINLHSCTTVPYTINYIHKDIKWCELFVLILPKKPTWKISQGSYGKILVFLWFCGPKLQTWYTDVLSNFRRGDTWMPPWFCTTVKTTRKKPL